jgi:hypothetical protein
LAQQGIVNYSLNPDLQIIAHSALNGRSKMLNLDLEEPMTIGEFAAHLMGWERCCPMLGKPETYLYPLQFDRLVEAQRRRDDQRAEIDRNGARLAYEKSGLVDVENL